MLNQADEPAATCRVHARYWQSSSRQIRSRGFGAPSTFGCVIPTPTLDRIAANGLRYTNWRRHSPRRQLRHTEAFSLIYQGLCHLVPWTA
jgi:hypothetical protein